jgi:hypothetical protein
MSEVPLYQVKRATIDFADDFASAIHGYLAHKEAQPLQDPTVDLSPYGDHTSLAPGDFPSTA